MVRAWLLSNPVLDNPLDLMLYCYSDESYTRPATQSLRVYQYHDKDTGADWADCAAEPMPNMHYRAVYLPPRFDYRNANRSGDYKARDAISVSLPGSLRSSSDVAGTRGKRQDSTGMPPLPVADTVESALASTLLSVQSLSQLNVPMSSDLHGCLTRGSETLKRGALADDENLDSLILRKHV